MSPDTAPHARETGRDLETLMAVIRERIRPHVRASTFRNWIEPLQLVDVDRRHGEITIAAPAFMVARIEDRYAHLIEIFAWTLLRTPPDVTVRVVRANQRSTPAREDVTPPPTRRSDGGAPETVSTPREGTP